jgi:hypothetical protein
MLGGNGGRLGFLLVGLLLYLLWFAVSLFRLSFRELAIISEGADLRQPPLDIII